MDSTKESFPADEKTLDAVVRNFEIIGEARARLPDTFKETHPTIEWRQIVGLRNRIVHEYFGVDPEIVWTIIRKDPPTFKSTIRSVRESLRTD